MRNASRHFALGGMALLLVALAAPAQSQTDPMQKGTVTNYDTDTDMKASTAAAVEWSDLKAEGFDPGAKLAVIHGDPGSSGDYTVRLKFPAGYKFPVHWHPNTEHLTVLSGTFILGMGTAVNAAAQKTYGPGDFLYIPGKHPHFGGAKTAAVIQLHGMGPFTINLGVPK